MNKSESKERGLISGVDLPNQGRTISLWSTLGHSIEGMMTHLVGQLYRMKSQQVVACKVA